MAARFSSGQHIRLSCEYQPAIWLISNRREWLPFKPALTVAGENAPDWLELAKEAYDLVKRSSS